MALCDDPNKITVIQSDTVTEIMQQSGIGQKQSRQEIVWSEPQPIKNDLLPVESITPDMLPQSLSGWLVDITERMDDGALDFAAVGSIVTCSALIGRKVGAHPKQHDSWLVIPNLWGCMVGRPSTKKSPVFNQIEKPVRKLEAQARE